MAAPPEVHEVNDAPLIRIWLRAEKPGETIVLQLVSVFFSLRIFSEIPAPVKSVLGKALSG